MALDFWEDPPRQKKEAGPEKGISFEDQEIRSRLSFTYDDHVRTGSTGIDPALESNRGKTLAETMSDEKLTEYIQEGIAILDGVYAEIPDESKTQRDRIRAMNALQTGKERLLIDIDYLKSIKRLPTLPDIDLRKPRLMLRRRYPD